ncbi:MAG: hypothetical protein ACPGR3_04060, partial [Ilumatobacteraceae bacterium]
STQSNFDGKFSLVPSSISIQTTQNGPQNPVATCARGVRGISHNPAEITADEDLIAGCQVLCDVMLELAATTFEEAK